IPPFLSTLPVAKVVDRADRLAVPVIDPGDPLADQAEELIADGAGVACQLVEGDLLFPVPADDCDDVVLLDIRDAGDVDHNLVHADAADHLCPAAVDQDARLAAHAAEVAVGVADRDSGD